MWTGDAVIPDRLIADGGPSGSRTTARFYVRDSLTDDELFEGEQL